MTKQQTLTLATAAVLALGLVAFLVLGQRDPGAGAAVAQGDFELERQPGLGSPDAPVEVIVFEDFQCPSCRVFEENVKPRLVRDYVETGRARLYVINFQFLGPDSVTAGIAAECAFEQNPAAFWDYKTYIYRSQGAQNQGWASPQQLVAIARNYVPELDHGELESCVLERRYEDRVLRDRAIAQAAGISGTPAVLVDRRQVSSPTFEAVSQAIEAQLAGN